MRIYLMIVLFIPWFLSAQIQKQDTIKIDEVIIDAGKTRQKIQKIPLSVTAVSAKQIETLKIDNLTSLNGFVPNLFMPEHGTRLNTDVYIRGIGVSKGEPSVGVYVDDIPYFDSGTLNFELADVNKIEVLRGPQGTLYGRNTMGGLIKVYTPEPVFRWKGTFKLDYGNYNQQKAVGGLNIPITQKLSLLTDIAYAHKDGFFTNRYDGSRPDAMDTYTGRIKMLYKISDSVKIRMVTGYEKNNQAGFPYAVYDSLNQTAMPIDYNRSSAYDRVFFSGGIFMNYKARNFDVNFSGSYQNLVDNYEIDQDFLPVDIYFIDMERDNQAYVEELTFKSKSANKLQWIAGLFSFQRHLYKDVWVDITTSHGIMQLYKTYDQNIDGGALFGQLSLPFDKWLFTAGLRWDMEKSRMDYNYDVNVANRNIHKDDFVHYLSYNQLLPKLGLTYTTGKHINIYAGITKGYKAGGFNATIERSEDETYQPEYTWNYEAGLKSTWLNHKLTANMSLFYIDWKDQQVVQSVPSGRGIMIKNAGYSTSRGFELEARLKLNSTFDISCALGYTDAEFDVYKKNETVDYSGNYIPLVPKFTYGTSAGYNFWLNGRYVKFVKLNVNYTYFGKFYWEVSNEAYQDAYSLLNVDMRIALKNKISLGLWGKNLLNTSYNRYYFTISTLHKAYVEPARPMQFGGYVKVKF